MTKAPTSPSIRRSRIGANGSVTFESFATLGWMREEIRKFRRSLL